MENMYSRIKELCDQKNISIASMCKAVGIGRSSLTELKAGRTKTLSAVSTAKIANFFGVNVEYLLGEPQQQETPALTKKDERDIAKKLNETLDLLENAQDGLMFDGEPLDDETKELLRMSLKNQYEMTKKLTKQKFTPKKYR